MFWRVFTIIGLTISEVPYISIGGSAFFASKIECTNSILCLTDDTFWCNSFILSKSSLKCDLWLDKGGRSCSIRWMSAIYLNTSGNGMSWIYWICNCQSNSRIFRKLHISWITILVRVKCLESARTKIPLTKCPLGNDRREIDLTNICTTNKAWIETALNNDRNSRKIHQFWRVWSSSNWLIQMKAMECDYTSRNNTLINRT